MICGLNAVRSGEVVGWAWVRGDGLTGSGCCSPTGQGDDIGIALVTGLVDLLDSPGQEFDIRTPRQDVSEGVSLLGCVSSKTTLGRFFKDPESAEAMWTALDSISRQVHIEAPWDALTPTGQSVLLARKAARKAATTSGLVETSQESPRTDEGEEASVILAGTDGSEGFGRRTWAWVSADGRYRWGSASGPIQVQELKAVIDLLVHTPRSAKVVALTDSRLVADVANGIVLPNRLSGKTRSAAERLVRLMADREVEVRWVRGHDGHWLNETAHRLALYRRRVDDCHENGHPVPTDVVEKTVTQMFEDGRRALLDSANTASIK